MSILFSYVSYQCLQMLKSRIEMHNLPGIAHGAGGLNYSSPLVFFPIFVVFVCPTLSIYLYSGSDSLWMLLVYLILNMVFYNFIGSLLINLIFNALNINYLNPRKKSNMILVNLLSLGSLLTLIIAYFFVL